MRIDLRTSALLASLSFGLLFSGCRSASAPTSDSALASAVQGKIASDPSLASEPIHTSVQNGVATLDGTVSNTAVRELASRDAAQVPGLKTIVNNLTVQEAAAQPSLPPPQASTPQPAPPTVTARPEDHIRTRKPSAAEEPHHIAQVVPPPQPAINPPAPAPIERVQPQQPAPPPAHDITVPSGTTLPVRITQTLDSASTQQGENFTGVIASDVFIDGLNVIPQGTPVSGRVTAVQDAGHFKGNSLLTIQITSINRNGQRIPVTTESFSKEGNGRGKNTAEKVGGGAALGAILGGIFGGGKGAALGGLAGGGVGAGAQAVTRGQQVQIPSETLVRFRTTSAMSVRTSPGQTSPTPDPTLQRHNNQ